MKKAFFLILIVIIVVSGCTHPTTTSSENQHVGFVDLTPVVCLLPDNTSIPVYEIMRYKPDVDSISVSHGANVYLSQDRQQIHVSGYEQLPVGFLELKIWQQGNFVSIILRNVEQHENLGDFISDKAALRINTSDFTLKRIMIAYDSPVEEWFVLWNNHRLSKRLYASGNGMLTIYIPREASSIPESYIRVCGQAGTNTSNMVIIPLKDGAVVKNSDDLLSNDIHHALIYQFDSLCSRSDKHVVNTNDSVSSRAANDFDETDIHALFPLGYFEELHVSDFLHDISKESRSEKFGDIFSARDNLVENGLFNATLEAFAGSGLEGFVELSGHVDSIMRQNASSKLGCFYSGYHGEPRFMTVAGSALQPDDKSGLEDNFRITITDLAGYDKAASHMAFLMTIPGIPVLFQSDETGLPDGDLDSYYRAMNYDSLSPEEKNLLEKIQFLTYLRRKNLVLQYGDFQTLYLDNDVWVYIRRYFSHNAVVFFNRSSQPASVTVSLPKNMRNLEFYYHYGQSPVVEGSSMMTDLNPYSFEIFIN